MKPARKRSAAAAFEIILEVRPISATPSEALPASNLPTESLVGRLLDAHEEERRRISREIHDNLGGKITEMTLLIHRMTRRKAVEREVLLPDLDQLLKKTMEIAQTARTVSQQLHSPILKFVGLAPALKSLCREFETHSGLRVRFTANPQPTPISSEISLCLYRIVQESLTNVAKHSGAKSASVKLKHAHHEVHLSIRDSGIGFSQKSLRKSGLGLVSMQERVRLLQGWLQIRTRPGSGTQVHATIPIPS